MRTKNKMRKYLPSVITQTLERFYIIPTIGIDWDPGVSFTIGVYVGTVSFQLGWSYGSRFIPSDYMSIDTLNLTENDLGILLDAIEEPQEPNEALKKAVDRYHKEVDYIRQKLEEGENSGMVSVMNSVPRMGDDVLSPYLEEYESYRAQTTKYGVIPMTLNSFVRANQLQNNLGDVCDTSKELYKDLLYKRVSKKHGKIDTTWLDNVHSGDERWMDKDVVKNRCTHCGEETNDLTRAYINMDSVDNGEYLVCGRCLPHYEKEKVIGNVLKGETYIHKGIPTLEGEIAESFVDRADRNEYKKYLGNLADHMTYDQWLEEKYK